MPAASPREWLASTSVLAQGLGVTWPLPKGLDEVQLSALLFPAKAPPSRFAEPDYFVDLTDELQEGLAMEGWEFLVDFDPALFRQGAAERWRALSKLPADHASPP